MNTKAERNQQIMTLTVQEELPNRLRPFAQGAMTASAYTQGTNMLASDLAQLIKIMGAGDLSHAEGMLIAQAQTLDCIFNHLAQLAAQRLPNMNIKGTEIFLRLAMKAQSQCRATLEALASLKSPSVVYAKQANFANGPQQVNNGAQ